MVEELAMVVFAVACDTGHVTSRTAVADERKCKCWVPGCVHTLTCGRLNVASYCAAVK